MRVLLAEDDDGLRAMLRDVVEELGHQCIPTADGQAAWDAFLAQPVDFVLSDWAMPRLNGLELCRRVRADTERPYAYFLFLTASPLRDQMFAGLEAGADDYLIKPIDLNELEWRLRLAERVTALRRQRDTLLRREGVLLAARTAQHELNNQLALTVGYAEMLARSPELPPHLREVALEALRGAERSAEIIARLMRLTQIEERSWGAGSPNTIDMQRSA